MRIESFKSWTWHVQVSSVSFICRFVRKKLEINAIKWSCIFCDKEIEIIKFLSWIIFWEKLLSILEEVFFKTRCCLYSFKRSSVPFLVKIVAEIFKPNRLNKGQEGQTFFFRNGSTVICRRLFWVWLSLMKIGQLPYLHYQDYYFARNMTKLNMLYRQI